MSQITDTRRATFAGIADVLIPAFEGMPSASSVDVHGKMLDHVVSLRPDLVENLLRGLDAAAGKPPEAAANDLNKTDPAALSAAAGPVAADPGGGTPDEDGRRRDRHRAGADRQRVQDPAHALVGQLVNETRLQDFVDLIASQLNRRDRHRLAAGFLLAGLSLLLWSGVLIAGRLIPFV